MMDDDWLKTATADVSLVAELLLRLHHSQPLPPPTTLPLKWSVRQPRSRSLAHKTGVARASPTTPLSWTGGSTSQSGGGAAGAPAVVDGSEESSRPGPGSKLTSTNEATISKRSRKKKTMIELKEEEILLLKEKKELKRTLESILVNLERERSANTSLKKIKLELESQKPNTDWTLEKLVISEFCPSIVPPIIGEVSAALPVLSLPTRCSEVKKEVKGDWDKFVIPDLNVAFVESNTEGPSETRHI